MAIFAFLNGYLIFCNYDYYIQAGYRFRKVFSLLIKYWVVLLILFSIGCLFGEYLPKGLLLVANLFGFCTNTNQYLGVGTGWYIGFYIIVILLVPILFIRKKNSRRVIWFILMVLLYCFKNHNYSSSEIQKLINNLYFYIPIVLVGFTCAEQGVIIRLTKSFDKLISKNIRWCVSILCMPAVFFLRLIINHFLHDYVYVDWIVIVPFILVALWVYSNTIINKISLCKFAGHITNIWLLHSFIFSPNGSMQYFAYWPRLAVIVIIWTLVLCLCVSIVITPIQNLIVKNIDRIIINGAIRTKKRK